MTVRRFHLEGPPEQALASLRRESRDEAVLVFKKSPICPVSSRAEAELEMWVTKHDSATTTVALAVVDVIAERTLARGLTAALDVRHESPQALWFERGELTWHGSHGELTRSRFADLAAQDS